MVCFCFTERAAEFLMFTSVAQVMKATYPDIHLKLNHIERKITEEHNA